MYHKARRMIGMLNGDENFVHIQISDGKQEAVLDIPVEDTGPGADFLGNMATALEQFHNSIAHRIRGEVRKAHMD